MTDFESWELYADFHDRRDYAGLVVHSENEVARSPRDLHAAERLADAYVLNGDYEKAIHFVTPIHHDWPDIASFQDTILDALFALGRAEDDFDWSVRPTVMRLGPDVSEKCYDFLCPKRKPRSLYDVRWELEKRAYLAFTDDELLDYLQQDSRFVVVGSGVWDVEVSVARQIKGRTRR